MVESKAVFAGGCFWCTESAFASRDGVQSVTSGYIGGTSDTANYPAVSSKGTEHVEAIEITYDSSKTSYDELLDIFWRSIDPTDVEFGSRSWSEDFDPPATVL